MSVWISILMVVQILAALAMIGFVLVQRGKGADMGISFGSGASGSLFGATGSANFLSRSTAVCATVFFASTVALVYVNDKQYASGATAPGASILEQAPATNGLPAIPTAPKTEPAAAPATVPATPSVAPEPAAQAPAGTVAAPPAAGDATKPAPDAAAAPTKP